MTPQASLFGAALPDGFLYRPEVVAPDEERALMGLFATLEFSNVEMRGGVARRRTAHYGWTYGYYARRTSPGTPLPDFLLPLRSRLAEWAGLEPARFEEALVTEYPVGAPIGWHRDAPMFGDVIAGVSLGGACRMRFRFYVSPGELLGTPGPRRATHSVELAARSAYLITGKARREYEHSIPPVDEARYSITFRTLATPGRQR